MKITQFCPMKITQFCPTCRELVRAKHETQHRDGMLIFDISWCEWCDKTLWYWAYQKPVPGETYKEPKRQKQQMSLF